MLNNGKIRLMTKIALYEEKEEKKALLANRFYKNDYISYHVIKVLLSVTVSCVLCFGLMLLYYSETILTEASIAQLMEMGKLMLLLYGLVALAYLVISFVIYQERYRKTQKGLRKYHAYLKRLHQFYEQSSGEKTVKEEL